MFQILLEPSAQTVSDEPSVFSPSAGASVGLFIGGVVVVTLLGILIYRLLRVMRRPELHGTTREQILKRWAQIELTYDQSTMGAKLAVIEADMLLDQVLRSMAMPGETLGERLKSAAYRYPDITRVWGAHRLRNQLVHDSAFELASRQARQALDDFRSALKVLNVM